MKQPSFSMALPMAFPMTLCVAVVSVLLFSGQRTRPVSPPQQQQATQQPQAQQRQVQQRQAPPKPAVTPVGQKLPVEEMPSFLYLPEDVKFPEMPPGASRNVTLFGDPKNEGLYVTRTLIPKGAQTIPHAHSDSRIVTVLSGICYYGRGEEFDESRTIPMPPGSFFTEPAGIPHFIWAKEGDVIVQTTAIGPSGTQIIPEKQGNPVPVR
jgi:quercetin dioxygenase-like cupin family protein